MPCCSWQSPADARRLQDKPQIVLACTYTPLTFMYTKTHTMLFDRLQQQPNLATATARITNPPLPDVITSCAVGPQTVVLMRGLHVAVQQHKACTAARVPDVDTLQQHALAGSDSFAAAVHKGCGQGSGKDTTCCFPLNSESTLLLCRSNYHNKLERSK